MVLSRGRKGVNVKLRLRDLIWLAGFVDGEGYLGIVKKDSRYQAQIRIVTTHKPTMAHVAKLINSSLYMHKYKSTPHWRNAFSVVLYDKRCELLIKQLFPFLITKKAQAKNLLEYRKTIEYGRNQCSAPRKVDQRQFYEKGKLLNLKGQPN